MKRYLFRGKRVDNGEWVEGHLSFIYVNGKNENGFIFSDKAQIYCQEEVRNYDVLVKTIGQCIGIKDLNGNGKLIFEGDILLVFYHTGETEKFTVVWDEELCSFRVVDKYGKKWTLSQTKCQIIGNIHDKEGE